MSWAYVQGNIHQNLSTSSTTVAVTLTSPVSSGNLVCVSVGVASSSLGSATVADDKGNAYNAVDGVLFDDYVWRTFYLAGVTNSPQTITATFSGALTFATILVDEFSGDASGLSIDGHAINSQASSSGANSVTSGSITPTTNGDLVYGSSVCIDSTGITAGTGFTQAQNDGSSFATEYKTQASAAATATTYTPTSLQHTITAVMAFKAATGAAFMAAPNTAILQAVKRASYW